jgi:YbbR domain-containing protein
MRKFLITYCLLLGAVFCIQHASAGKSLYAIDSDQMVSVNAQFVDVYPNPAIEDIFLKFQDPVAQKVSLEIRSFIGNKLTVNAIIENSDLIKVDVSQLAAGHYYVIITFEGEKTLKKFIKRG